MKLGMNTTMFWNANYLTVFEKSILNTSTSTNEDKKLN